MGVKDLWTILSPVKRDKILADLAGKTLAVDLSGWVCQADTAKGLASSVHKPYLRNLFFRIHRLYSEGVSLVMVVDGEATRLKWSVMDQRKLEQDRSHRGRGRASYHGSRRTGRRTQLNSKTNECLQLLNALGVPYLQSKGEAEALCGLLNEKGLVDGVLTQDGDAFLYGARVIYKDLSTNEKDSHVSCFELQDIESNLGLNRRDMVSLGLLLGCDYCPQGVPHVGKEGAMKLIRVCKSHDKSCDMLDIMRGWSNGTRSGDVSKIEAQVKSKALLVDGFPSEAVINEYLHSENKIPHGSVDFLTWKFPQIVTAQVVCRDLLEWPYEYTHKKVLSLVTQWLLRKSGMFDKRALKGHLKPLRVNKLRKRQGVEYYEVEWKASGNLATLLTEETISLAMCPSRLDDDPVQFTTLEKTMLFGRAYPPLCAEFEGQRKQSKQRSTATEPKDCTKERSRVLDSDSADDLSSAMSKLGLFTSHTEHQHKPKTSITDVEPVSTWCTDDLSHASKSVCTTHECTQMLRDVEEESDCIEILPLAERLRTASNKKTIKHAKTSSTPTVELSTHSKETFQVNPTLPGDDAPMSYSKEKASSHPDILPTLCAMSHSKSCGRWRHFEDDRYEDETKHFDDMVVNDFPHANQKKMQKNIVNVYSSESEMEDPLFRLAIKSIDDYPIENETSDNESSSDDSIPPLFNRIGGKCEGMIPLSSCKYRTSPTVHSVVKSETESESVPLVQTLTRKPVFESPETKSKASCHGITKGSQFAASKTSESASGSDKMYNSKLLDKPFAVLSGNRGIGSAESPIEID